MACSSTSSVHKSFKYDVFLSFRGEDTRTNFVDHLYYALNNKSIRTYKDDQRIRKGKNISDELIESIENSKFYIIVFSKNYASSSWCLDELVKIMECQKTIGHTAYPIFYDVEPSEVRKQSGPVAAAFARLENEEAAGKWREVLKEAADLAGWELKKTANGHEAEFIQKIVQELSQELHSIYSNIDEGLVGMDIRIKDVESLLGIGFDDVRMIGIKGMGGGGKTTLARAVFDHISVRFEGRSFVENVRENASLSGLKSLQEQILSDVLNDKDISVNNVSDGTKMMKWMMHDKKVLVVLDDVDHIDQLEALAGRLNCFKPGSRIIITTRDEQVLVAHRVEFIRDVSLLSNKEAICLFRKYAFARDIPTKKYEELLIEVVRYAAGLPLTIKVLGSHLCGKNELEWVDALKRLKTIPLAESLKKLELSYNNLEDDHKEIFLDIACILKGLEKEDAIKALESCGFHARHGLRVLEQKSLITINCDSNDYVWVGMHDLVEEMGRNIVRRSNLDKPYKHSRLWKIDEIEDILANDLGTKATKCIQFHAKKFNQYIFIKGLRKMNELRFLSVCGDCFRNLEFCTVGPDFPHALRYLRWDHYPFRSLPETFQAKNLVALEMDTSRIVQLWEGGERKVLNKLRFLDLSYSKLCTFDLGLTPNLETLTLQECDDLVDIRMTAECLKLISVDLTRSRLKTLDLGLAPNLEELILIECNNLEELHMANGCQKLTKLKISHLNLRTLDLGTTPNLKTLELKECPMVGPDFPNALQYLRWTKYPFRCLPTTFQANNLVALEMDGGKILQLWEGGERKVLNKLRFLDLSSSMLSTFDLGLTPNIETLTLRGCYDLVDIHMTVGCLKLISVDLTRSGLKTLDLGLAPNLEELILVECNDLEKLQLPERCLNLRCLLLTNSKLRTLNIGLTPNLEKLDLQNSYCLEELHMVNECQKLAELKISHSKLRTLDLGMTPNIKKLDIKECRTLVELHAPIGCLKKLVHVDLSGCLRFRYFQFQVKGCASSSVDESLDVAPLAEFGLFVESLERCGLHPDNNLPMFRFNCVYKEDRPSFTRNLEMLFSLGRCACTNAETFSGSICWLRHLKKLELSGSFLELIKDLDQLECLEELSLSSTDIKHLPDSIFMLKHLKSLKLKGSPLLKRLPEDLDRLECLEELTLSSTMVNHLPGSICKLKHLKSLTLDNFWHLEGLPEDLGPLECLEELSLLYNDIKYLPDSILMFKHLKSLIIEPCFFLEKLPDDLYQLECLEKLILSSGMIKRLPDSICMLKHLKSLKLISCWVLENQPENLGRLECLEELDLSFTKIKHLPGSICMLKSLKSLKLYDCFLLEKLPEDLGQLECLEFLNIEGTNISHLPESISLLKGLHIQGRVK